MIREWENGDLKTSGVQFATGQRETELAVRYRLLLFLGEYFLDVTDGTPWFQGVLGKAPQDLAEINLKQRILTARRVVALERFDFQSDRTARKLTVTARVLDVDSNAVEAAIDEELF